MFVASYTLAAYGTNPGHPKERSSSILHLGNHCIPKARIRELKATPNNSLQRNCKSVTLFARAKAAALSQSAELRR